MTKTLAGSDIREAPRVIRLMLLTLGVIGGTSFLIHKLGLGWVWEFIHGLPFWQGFGLSAALWGAIILLLLNLPHIARAAMKLFRQVPVLIRALARTALSAAVFTCRAIVAALAPVLTVLAALARIAEPFRMGLMLIAEPLLAALAPVFKPVRKLWRSALAVGAVLDPLHDLWRSLVMPLVSRAADFHASLRFEWTLWRTYRAEFRGVYASYWEFKTALKARAYSDPGESHQDDPPPRDPFASACEVMGLPADGSFTESQFKARYRALMKEVHPDIAGPNRRAAEVNAASMEIRKRKGWS